MGEVSVWDASPSSAPPAVANPSPELAAPPAVAAPVPPRPSSRTVPAIVALVALLAAAVLTAGVRARS